MNACGDWNAISSFIADKQPGLGFGLLSADKLIYANWYDPMLRANEQLAQFNYLRMHYQQIRSLHGLSHESLPVGFSQELAYLHYVFYYTQFGINFFDQMLQLGITEEDQILLG